MNPICTYFANAYINHEFKEENRCVLSIIVFYKSELVVHASFMLRGPEETVSMGKIIVLVALRALPSKHVACVCAWSFISSSVYSA